MKMITETYDQFQIWKANLIERWKKENPRRKRWTYAPLDFVLIETSLGRQEVEDLKRIAQHRIEISKYHSHNKHYYDGCGGGGKEEIWKYRFDGPINRKDFEYICEYLIQSEEIAPNELDLIGSNLEKAIEAGRTFSIDRD